MPPGLLKPHAAALSSSVLACWLGVIFRFGVFSEVELVLGKQKPERFL